MNWPEERYVRLYVRDTVEWDMLPWQSRALFPLLVRKVDRAGLLELGKYGPRGLAHTVGLPVEVVEPGLSGLIEDGCVAQTGTTLVVPNFIEAQEATASDAARSKAYRERKRAETVEAASRDVTESSRVITDRHEPTESSPLSVPSLAVPNRTEDIPSPSARESFDFEAGYALYPRKIGHKKGMQRCRSQITSRSKYDAWMKAIANYAAKVRAEGATAQYVKHFDTFMGCWEDYAIAGSTPTASRGSLPLFSGKKKFRDEEDA